jgi:hypothetical protein
MANEIKYKGKTIEVKFPSGMFEYYSDKEGRFLKFDTLKATKESINNEGKLKTESIVTKKISLNELRSLVKQIIKEETDPYNGKIEIILSDISKLKSEITNKSPKTFVRDGFIYLSAEDGSHFADYYGEFKGEEMYIDPRLEKIADKYDMYWDWENPGTIILGY